MSNKLNNAYIKTSTKEALVISPIVIKITTASGSAASILSTAVPSRTALRTALPSRIALHTIDCYSKRFSPFVETWSCKKIALSFILIHIQTIFIVSSVIVFRLVSAYFFNGSRLLGVPSNKS